MEWIVINPVKLKIMLRKEDMQRYDLRDDQLDSADEQTRHTLRQIFEEARLHTGFDTSGERLFVQLYTSRDGGCEIFVTKLNSDAAEDAQHPSPEDALLQRLLLPVASEASRPASPVVASTRTLAFSFNGLDPLLRACRRLYRNHVLSLRGTSAYIDDRSTATSYYLFLTVPDRDFLELPHAYAFLSEYGERVSPKRLSVYLGEHGKILCRENAVQVLGQL